MKEIASFAGQSFMPVKVTNGDILVYIKEHIFSKLLNIYYT